MESQRLPVRHPLHIRARRAARVLEIEWDNGHRSRYSFAALRAACPCAECRTGGTRTERAVPEDPLLLPVLPTRSHELEHLEQVGNYALQLIWKDGHRFGIYPWDYLWQLCPCEEHRAGLAL